MTSQTNAVSTNRLQPQPAPAGKPSALAVMASRYSVDPNKLLDTLKATVFQKATNEELLALVVVANEFGLNPFLKELYAFPAKGGGIVPIVSVDGWNKLMLRQPDFDGIDFEFEHYDHDGVRELISCTATVHTKSRTRPVRITEYLDECKRDSQPWRDMPHRMLRNRTLCQAARVAFGFSGIHDEDEAQSIVVESYVQPPAQIQQAAATSGNPQPAAKNANEELGEVIIAAGFTFDQFSVWALQTNNVPGIESYSSFDEIPVKDARRILRNTAGVIADLEKQRAEAGGAK